MIYGASIKVTVAGGTLEYTGKSEITPMFAYKDALGRAGAMYVPAIIAAIEAEVVDLPMLLKCDGDYATAYGGATVNDTKFTFEVTVALLEGGEPSTYFEEEDFLDNSP